MFDRVWPASSPREILQRQLAAWRWCESFVLHDISLCFSIREYHLLRKHFRCSTRRRLSASAYCMSTSSISMLVRLIVPGLSSVSSPTCFASVEERNGKKSSSNKVATQYTLALVYVALFSLLTHYASTASFVYSREKIMGESKSVFRRRSSSRTLHYWTASNGSLDQPA